MQTKTILTPLHKANKLKNFDFNPTLALLAPTSVSTAIHSPSREIESSRNFGRELEVKNIHNEKNDIDVKCLENSPGASRDLPNSSPIKRTSQGIVNKKSDRLLRQNSCSQILQKEVTFANQPHLGVSTNNRSDSSHFFSSNSRGKSESPNTTHNFANKSLSSGTNIYQRFIKQGRRNTVSDFNSANLNPRESIDSSKSVSNKRETTSGTFFNNRVSAALSSISRQASRVSLGYNTNAKGLSFWVFGMD